MQNQQYLSLNTGSLSSPQHRAQLDSDQDQHAGSNLQYSQHQEYVSPATGRPKQYSALNKVSENPQFSHIFRKYHPNYIQSALALFRDKEDLLRPFERFSDVEKDGIARLLRSCPEKLVAVLDISADDRSFIQEFKDYGDADIQKVFEQLRMCISLRRKHMLKESLDNQIRTLPNPVVPPAKRLQTQPLSRVQHPSQSILFFDNSPTSLPLFPTETPKEASNSNQFPEYRCTYICGETFKREGNRNNHELTHHDGKRKIACQHTGCKVEVHTEPAYIVHHNRKHKHCELLESCRHSGEYLRPPKTASSCGYCGKLFEGESNFKDRGDHITREHHMPKDPKDRKAAREWSRNVQLEGKNGAEGMFSRQELAGWRDFKKQRARLHGISSNFSWERVPEKKWINFLELIEHGAAIADGAHWEFTDDVVRDIFDQAFKLGVHNYPATMSSHHAKRAAHPNIEPSAFLCTTETSFENVMQQPPDSGNGDCDESNDLDDNLNSISARHQWVSIDPEDQCRSCDADNPTQFACLKCNGRSCGACWEYYFLICDNEPDVFKGILPR